MEARECLENAEFSFTCNTSAMSPLLCKGDLVLVRRQSQIENGQLAVLRVDGETIVRKYCPSANETIYRAEDERYTLRLANADFSSAEVVGCVIGFVRPT